MTLEEAARVYHLAVDARRASARALHDVVGDQARAQEAHKRSGLALEHATLQLQAAACGMPFPLDCDCTARIS